jgi:hypothetical protein
MNESSGMRLFAVATFVSPHIFKHFVAVRSGNRAIAKLKRSAEQQTENSADGNEFKTYDC